MKKCNLLNVLQYVVHMWTLHLYMHIKKKIIIALPYLVSNSKKNYLKKKQGLQLLTYSCQDRLKNKKEQLFEVMLPKYFS